ncbi:mitochondrial dynamics protein MID49 [Engraulis encrasicolus]|uniref:mitochondrial dynamics protein MID49 n=1 Tax=Engraulis encrasicolus TaxID=184585 RepID=UPI002FCF0AA9
MYFHSRRRGHDGVGELIDFLLANARLVIGVGGAAILGIATLAVKRLIERASRSAEENKPITDGWEELKLVSQSPKQLKKELEGVVKKKIAAATKKGDLSLPVDSSPPPSTLEDDDSGLCLSGPGRSTTTTTSTSTSSVCERKRSVCNIPLQQRLERYYATRVCVLPDATQRAQRRALDVATEIQSFLHSKHAHMPLGELRLAGSLLDDLQVIRPDHASLLVHLQVEESLWSLVRGEDTFLSHPQLFLIRRENLEFFPRGRSYWDQFLVGGYLSAAGVAEMMSRSLTEALNWPSLSATLEAEVRPVLGGDDITLEVHPIDCSGGDGEEEETLFLRVLPTVHLGGESVCARPRLPCSHAWFCSQYPREAGLLASLDQSDGGIRRKLLKTLKAVCRTSPALRPITARHLSSLLLHLCQGEQISNSGSDDNIDDKERPQGDWSPQAFSGRFLQALEQLIGYLETGRLPSYFAPAVNHLQELSEEQTDEIGFMIYCALTQPDILLI